MKITLYTTHCPKCIVLEKKLANRNVDYEIVDDIDTIMNEGFLSAPVLKVDNTVMEFAEANKWINNL